MSSFSSWLEEAIGYDILDETQNIHQNVFSKYYTQWLGDVVLANESVENWLEGQLDALQFAAFQSGDYEVKLNQNDTEGAPYIEFGDGSTFDLTELFTGDKDSFSWTQGKAEQTRYFFDSFVEPAGVNEAPTNLHIAIDAGFAAAVAGSGAADSSDQNRLVEAGAGGLLIGVIVVTDPDVGDAHTLSLLVGSDPRFELVGDQLYLIEGESIETNEGPFEISIEVEDSAGNKYYENFSFQVGANSATPPANAGTADDIVGDDISGSGTEGDPTTGDDLLFGFAKGDTLTGDGGDDVLFGGKGDDTLIGGEGYDQLFGGVGDDILIGGADADLLSGGTGSNTFVWLAGDMDGTDADSFDVIIDWSSGASNSLDISDLLADFGFGGGDVLADWIEVTNDGGNTIVAVAQSSADATAGTYANLVTIQGVELNEADILGALV